MPSFPDMSGHIIEAATPGGGRLELLKSLGSGAYGEVYSAVDRDVETPRFYAIKCLPRHEKDSRQDIKQKRERRLHARVSCHESVITFHKAIYDDFFVFFILELCTGGTLFEAIRDDKLFYRNDSLLKLAFTQIIDAVHYCHENGVFHRDIKPENILCSKDATQIYLADFGLATHIEKSSSFGCGTSYYKSPECTGEVIRLSSYSTRASDVWSIGVVLVNMITSRSPWRTATLEDTGFRTFIRHRSYLEANLPLSRSSIRLLRRIFELNPKHRITLPELRQEILEIDTFFLSDEELQLCPKAVRDVASFFASVPHQYSPQLKQSIKFEGSTHRRGNPAQLDFVFQAEIGVEVKVELDSITSDVDLETPARLDEIVHAQALTGKTPGRRRRSSVVKILNRVIKGLVANHSSHSSLTHVPLASHS